MDKAKVEKLASLYEQLETVNRTLALKSPTWTFNVGATHKDGNAFECIDVDAVGAKSILLAHQNRIVAKIKQLGGTV